MHCNRPFNVFVALTITTLVAFGGLPQAPASAGTELTGVWFDDTGRGAVRIYSCRGRICGKIVWLKQPISKKTGQPLRDSYNPRPANRNRTVCGLQVISGLTKAGSGWDGGRIYDPKIGKSYDVAIDPVGADRIRVTGYLGVRLLGKSFIWRRAPANLPACTQDR